MIVDAEKQPALHQLINGAPIRPDGCAGCPFATPDPTSEEPNPTDPDEGNYLCALLEKTLWGEEPKCTLRDWQWRACEEVSAIQP